MKKTMIAAILGACASFVFADTMAPEGVNREDEECSNEGRVWRMTLGGFARGGMNLHPNGFKKERVEAYGADADFQFNLLQCSDLNLWADLGFSWAPNRRVYKKNGKEDIGAGFSYCWAERVQMQYGQLRLMLVPEWQATESLAFGVRLGVGLDWIRMREHYSDAIVPAIGAWSQSDKSSRFTAEGIAGLQATYMFTSNLGFYANIDARMGEKMRFKKRGTHVAKLDMSGWCAGAGLIVQF